MTDATSNHPDLQFKTAEYSGMPGSEKCKFCNQPIAQNYYRINGAMACAACADQARRQTPADNHAAYVRAVIYGSGAAILGLILYAAFGIITGLVIGYISLAVGYMIGKAMMMGSKGFGGRRYQITAALLTYAAVSMAAVPMGIAQYSKQKHQVQTTQQESQEEGQNEQTPDQQTGHRMSLVKALGSLAILGLTSPFLELQDPVHGLIGLVILLVGIRIAWSLTAGAATADVSGPFDNTASVPT